MILKFKQKMFSLAGKYQIFDEQDQVVYTIKGRVSIPKRFEISDASGQKVATLKSKVFDFLPTFRLFMGDEEIGKVKRKFSFFKPKFAVDCNGWSINGDIWTWNYQIVDANGELVATLTKKVFSLVDTYFMDIVNPDNALMVLMVVLAIDAEKAERGR
ncbi:MAG: LURP-one-related family protein [Clostridia bacterium]|nr:LURP-one-related family protein [Clostridia bacterium]MDE7329205.1 LURP-one-related family protein [Clostridia bacterium]